jgi:outer membrane protein TolC
MNPLQVRFNLLLNRSSDEVIELDSLNNFAGNRSFSADSIFVNNPTIASFDLKMNAITKQGELAKLSGLPSIGLGLDYVVVSKRNISTVAEDGKDILMPMATISLPIFRSQYKAAASEANYLKNALELNKEQYQNNRNSEFVQAEYKLTEATELIKLYESEIKTQTRILDLLYTSYSTSGKDFVELIRSQQLLIKYKMRLFTEIKNYHVAISQLEYLTNK